MSDVLPPGAKGPHGPQPELKGKGGGWAATGDFFQWGRNHLAHLTAMKSKNVNSEVWDTTK